MTLPLCIVRTGGEQKVAWGRVSSLARDRRQGESGCAMGEEESDLPLCSVANPNFNVPRCFNVDGCMGPFLLRFLEVRWSGVVPVQLGIEGSTGLGWVGVLVRRLIRRRETAR